MRYCLAIVFPPVAMFLCGKPFQGIVCLLLMLTILGWPLASIWALFVVHNQFADERNDKLIAAINRANRRAAVK